MDFKIGRQLEAGRRSESYIYIYVKTNTLSQHIKKPDKYRHYQCEQTQTIGDEQRTDPINNWGNLWCSGRVSSCYSNCGTRYVN
jgi:hypothetical protein